MTRTLAVFATLIAFGSAVAQVAPPSASKPVPPSGPGIGGTPMPAAPAMVATVPAFLPSFQKVAQVSPNTKTVAFEATVCFPVMKQVQETVEIDGKKETRQKTVCEYLCKTEMRQTQLSNATGYDGMGQKLTSEQMWQRLKPGDVIITVQGQLPDAAYMKLLNKDALVIVTPNVAPSAPVAIPAVPAIQPAPVPIAKPPM